MAQQAETLGVAVVGAGYWGPNLVRNFDAFEGTDLRWVCDLSRDRARKVVGGSRAAQVTDDLDQVLNDDSVDAVAIATPAGTHASVALACLDAGKHVLVEKPLAASVAEGEKMVAAANERGLTLMCDHTYCYTPVVRRIRDLVADGEVGEIQYVDAVRINLGLVQRDIDVFWDLAPHDLSILDFVLPLSRQPLAVAATGADPIRAGRACVGYLTLPLAGNAIAHAHVNWLSPTKVRTTIIGGSKRTIVWDDLHPYQRLSIHDRGVEVREGDDPSQIRERLVSYRIGDMVAPALPEAEALGQVVREFTAAIHERRPAQTDGGSGLRVLRILEAASKSLESGGTPVELVDYR